MLLTLLNSKLKCLIPAIAAVIRRDKNMRKLITNTLAYCTVVFIEERKIKYLIHLPLFN
jgi:hypothetical protein